MSVLLLILLIAFHNIKRKHRFILKVQCLRIRQWNGNEKLRGGVPVKSGISLKGPHNGNLALDKP